MPSLDRLRKALAAGAVAFVLISDDDGATIRAFLPKKTFSLTSYRSQASRPGLFTIDGIPTTFIVAPDGRIIVRHVGIARWDDPAAVTFIRSLASGRLRAAAGSMRPLGYEPVPRAMPGRATT
jgi:hypothetical protein